MSTLEVNKITPVGVGTSVTLGDSGDTFTIPSGVTLTNNGTVTGIGGVNSPAFHVTMDGTNQTGMSPNTNTKVQFNTEQFDTNGAYDTSNYRFTVPSGEAGKYFIGSNINFGSTSQGRSSYICIYKNGSQIQQYGQFFWTNYSTFPNIIEGTQDYTVSAMTILDLSVGDYIEIFGRRYDGTSIFFRGNTGNNFFGFKLIL